MKKILYIEDDPVSTIFVSKIIQKMGHEVVTANTSELGLSKAYAERPDLILMDVMLPGLDGFEMTMKMRNSETLKHTPIIAITGTHNAGDEQIATIAGCSGYITKPIEYAPFVKYMNSFLEGHEPEETPIEPKEENLELKKLSQRLVQRLTDKVNELSHTNTELEKSNKKLDRVVDETRQHNTDLLQTNEMVNVILGIHQREELYRLLPQMICDRLQLPSVSIYLVNEQGLTLDAFWHHQFDVRADSDKLNFTKPPFYDLVYHQEPFYIDSAWLNAARQVDDVLARDLASLSDAFHAPAVYFLPIMGKKQDDLFACQNSDCSAFNNKDTQWWKKEIHLLDPHDLDYPARLKNVSDFYFNCCLYNLKAILAIGVPEGRMNEPFRNLMNSFSTSIGMRLENIQLYDDVHDAFMVAEKQAITDGLTEVYNYRYFHHQLERELKRAKRHWYKVSLIMIDVDHFKHYNDLNGHPAGDEVLRRLAEIFRNTTRTSDIVARYGGEEFIIILPETPNIAALKLAEKIRATVEEEKFLNGNSQPLGKLTVSVGVATFPDESQSPEDLIQRADEQLYNAKSKGRNRVSSREIK